MNLGGRPEGRSRYPPLVLLDTKVLEIVALAAAGVALLALVLCVVLTVRLGRLRRAQGAVVAPGADRAPADASLQSGQVEGLRREVRQMRDDVAAARADLSDALRHVAVVRYDAFGDMGGRLSFSAALLDDAGDGLVLTSINGRSETRTYAKGVQAGDSEHTLSPEEQEAIGHATRRERGPSEPSVPAEPVARRRRSLRG